MTSNASVTKPERATQDRVVKLFKDQLSYRYLGNWEDRSGNSNIEEDELSLYLTKAGYSAIHISKTLGKLRAAANNPGSLYQSNKAVYELLRFGVPVRVEKGVNTETVQVINWAEPEQNRFAIAEEVTVFGEREKRPDVVLYINGIAVGVLELKNSRVSIGDGIRQSLTNQNPKFIGAFFATVQFVFAGNDSEGLKYGTIGTPEKYFLNWKEDEDDNDGYKLDKYLGKICQKDRFIELMYDFVLFDGGIKKLPRVHQYFGVKAAQEHIRRRQGGIIWHTQGSGKSITMVMLAKWILENNASARVLIVTDRDELDSQIERVFSDAGETIYRTSSGRDLMRQLGQATPRLLCSLVHKFGRRDVDNIDHFIEELKKQPGHGVGDVHVFVDECHRSQSGTLHKVMKAIMPGALFIGFTGTPLLKKDKKTSLEVFGHYIHTYKFNEAVDDGVVLDLIYEARDIDQRLGSQDKVDQWFEAKTRGLNDFQKAALKKKWSTMQKVLSSRSRMDKIVTEIVFDFGTKPRLETELGNAILVASSIYEACKYYELFQSTELKDKCAVITSYNPHSRDISKEDTGAGTETEKEYIYSVYTRLLENIKAHPGMTRTETYEANAKTLFIDEPATMKLLIVVDKLLTGFDAPSCSYLYIDKSMRDHGLFQAICRVNRLDTEDKEFGYIIDYMDLFKNVENALAVYTGELDTDDSDGDDGQILLKERLKLGKERLDKALEALELLCEPVQPPKDDLNYIHHFCGNTEKPDELKAKEPLRTSLYRAIVVFIRAYANIADDMAAAGYSSSETDQIKERMDFYLKLRELIRRASGETIDLKAYEADMRHLIDHYIQADDPRKTSTFDDMPLVEVIVNSGIAEAIREKLGKVKDQSAIAAAVAGNIRSSIIKSHLLDPAYFDQMSKLLDEVIRQRKEDAIAYEEYLKRIEDIARKVAAGKKDDTPSSLDTPAKRALYNNLNENEDLAIRVDAAVINAMSANWRGNTAKENLIKFALYEELQDEDEVERIFKIIELQQDY